MTNLIGTLTELGAAELEVSYDGELAEVVTLDNEDGEDLLEDLTQTQSALLKEQADDTVAALGGVYARHAVMSQFAFSLKGETLHFVGSDARWEAKEGDTLSYEANGGLTLAELMTASGLSQLDFVKETDEQELEVVALLDTNGDEFSYGDRNQQESWELDEEINSCLTEALSVWDSDWEHWEGFQGTAELKDGKVELRSLQVCDWTPEDFFTGELSVKELEALLA